MAPRPFSGQKQALTSMTNQALFTINSLLEGKSALVHITPVTADGIPLISASALHEPKGLGLEIENIASLPDADDYAQHEFYTANFTAAEIAHCTGQPRIKPAFQALLAAKRAIVKSGAVHPTAEGFRSVELGFGGEGRPTYPGCLLSISHTDTVAAAVCLWLGGEPPSPPAAAPAVQAPVSHLVKFPLRTRIFAFLILLSLLVIFALGLWKIFSFIRH
jgi:phosphopantetheinyl transferase (holo-ACP synthase)